MDATATPIPELILSAKWIGPLNYQANDYLTHGRISADTEWTANAFAEWTHPLTGDLALRLRGDAAYVGRQYWDLSGDER